MDDPIGTAGTELTVDMLRRGIDHLRYACPACGGNGEVRAESDEHYMGRLSGLWTQQGFITIGQSMLHMRECRVCDGTGRLTP